MSDDTCGAKGVIWDKQGSNYEVHQSEDSGSVYYLDGPRFDPLVIFCTLNKRHKGKHMASVAWDRKEQADALDT